MERIVTLGNDASLVGIFTEPQADHAKPDYCVLILNAGMVHKAGPFRTHVQLARHIASTGMAAFRFDYSGIGDSDGKKSTDSFEQRSVSEINMATDFLQQQFGYTKFIAIGFCSGADDVHRAMLANNQIVAGVMVDGYAYKTARYHLKKISEKLRTPSSWIRAPFRILAGLFSGGKTGSPAEEFDINPNFRDLPDKGKTASELKTMLRNKKMLFIYTGGLQALYNYESQFYDMYGLRKTPSLELIYYPEADHTFILEKHRQIMRRDISNWITKHAV